MRIAMFHSFSLTLAVIFLAGCRWQGGGARSLPSSPPRNPFVDPHGPLDDGWGGIRAGYIEQYAKSEGGWVNLDFRDERGTYVMQVKYLELGGGKLAPGYFVFSRVVDHFERRLYRWKGITLDTKEAPYDGAFHGTRINRGTDLQIVEVEPPVQFLSDDEGGPVLPGYFDFSEGFFYTFRHVAIPPTLVPPLSPQHRCPLVPGHYDRRDIARRPIPVPDQFRKPLAPWTHDPAASQSATTAAAAATTAPASETKNP